jgi:NAD-specific glutamate dehydrogenase
MIGALLAKPAVAGVVGFLRGIPREVWYALILLLAAWWAIDYVFDRGAASRDPEIANLQTMLETERAANASNIDTIEKLVAENQAWAAAAKTQQETADKAIAAVAGQRDALAAELAERRRDRGKIYATDQDAAAWARQPVPRALADQLRGE